RPMATTRRRREIGRRIAPPYEHLVYCTILTIKQGIELSLVNGLRLGRRNGGQGCGVHRGLGICVCPTRAATAPTRLEVMQLSQKPVASRRPGRRTIVLGSGIRPKEFLSQLPRHRL